jgi:predicted ABC-type sugar transport system permease subunit
VSTAEVAPSRVTTRTVERSTGRNWKKTALVIGGSSAAGAGIGAIFGGKKGALIGAAIGGGASTIYETRR